MIDRVDNRQQNRLIDCDLAIDQSIFACFTDDIWPRYMLPTFSKQKIDIMIDLFSENGNIPNKKCQIQNNNRCLRFPTSLWAPADFQPFKVVSRYSDLCSFLIVSCAISGD